VQQKYGEIPPQEIIARDMGISQSTVSRWLTGYVRRFDDTTIVAICQSIPCEVGDLFYVEQERAS
jgi:DNA-binding Xre family transcriptional regulator